MPQRLLPHLVQPVDVDGPHVVVLLAIGGATAPQRGRASELCVSLPADTLLAWHQPYQCDLNVAERRETVLLRDAMPG